MIEQHIHMQDQFGVGYLVQATLKHLPSDHHSPIGYIEYITVEGEVIRPNFQISFQSDLTGKIYRAMSSS